LCAHNLSPCPRVLALLTKMEMRIVFFLTVFQELAKTYAARDLVEEYIGTKIFPIRAGWSVVTWSDFSSTIKIPKFAKRFGLMKNGAHLSLFSLLFLTALRLIFLLMYIFILLILV
jgi:hypothetical protein